MRLRETADTGNRCVFLVGPDALIGPFPGGPVCRPYKGDRNLIPYPARATERVAPTSTCLKPDGRVRTPAPTAYTKAVRFFVGASPRPARGRGTPPGWLLSAFGRFTFSPSPTDFKDTFRVWVGEPQGDPAGRRASQEVTLIPHDLRSCPPTPFVPSGHFPLIVGIVLPP